MSEKQTHILSLLKINPSPQSLDYINNKKQFQLHTLMTEQRHPRTWNLSGVIKDNAEEGLKQIFSVDEDISQTFHYLAQDITLLNRAAQAVSLAIREGRKVFIYGCGATGRLAKQMESTFWRPFWRRIKAGGLWEKIKAILPGDIEALLIGEMTGGDRALISALEGFEDLQVVGKLQLQERGIERGDVVFGITEGGETSSVIGAMQAALGQYGKLSPEKIEAAKNHLYFLYNNPDDVLKPFYRSRLVIENPAITRINLTTGPQAIAGSTRMQAATSETYVMGIILEAGIHGVLRDILYKEELLQLGFPMEFSLKERLFAFDDLIKLSCGHIKDIAGFTCLESQTYQNQKKATYFAKKALITVFIDCAERSPTFHLYPLDTVHEKQRKCWLQVWTEGRNFKQAWQNFLGRSFKGLDEPYYKPHFINNIDDVYLKEAALKSLSNAGDGQEMLYDFSFSEKNITARGPQVWDLGVLVCMDEEIMELTHPDSTFFRFITLFKAKKASVALILISDKSQPKVKDIISRLPLIPDQDIIIHINMGGGKDDPLGLKPQILLKILLNGHSTGVMARLGRIVGNTMTNVNPSNLKLIGRATHLILNHVNDVLSQDEWIRQYGETVPLTYGEINAILFAAMDFMVGQGGQTSELELCILRILESLKNKRDIDWEKALSLLESSGLETYLESHNPALRRFF